MTTRSEKASQGARFPPVGTQSSSSPRTGEKRRLSPADLEEELARPTKPDYNLVRNALKATRSASERQSTELKSRQIEIEKLKRELREKDHVLKSQDANLTACQLFHVNMIQYLRDKVIGLERKEEMRKKDESVKPAPEEPVPEEPVPEEQASTEKKETTAIGNSMVDKLRTAIHVFAATYFGSKLQNPLTAVIGAGWAEQFMQATTPGEDTYMHYLLSRRRCPMIIEAFIWRFLCGTIFDGAAWGGSEEIRRHVSELQKILGECK